jgi:hypothetical protein
MGLNRPFQKFILDIEVQAVWEQHFLERLPRFEVGVFPEFGRFCHKLTHVIYCGFI